MNLADKRELLNELAFRHLHALRESNPVGRDETPLVYISKGELLGVCRVFGVYFEVELRKRIKFYRGQFVGEGKFWFQVEDNTFSDEEMNVSIQRMNHENRELFKFLNEL